MKKDLDLNDIARFEKAIAKKYGNEAIENPRKHWNDEKVELDGFFICKKLLTRETTRRVCPICTTYSYKIRDDVFMNKFDCCFSCYIQHVEGREERWLTGWRPEKEKN